MLLYACVQHHPNTKNIACGERGGGYHHCSSSFHDWSKITQCPKNFQPFLAAIVGFESASNKTVQRIKQKMSYNFKLPPFLIEIQLHGQHINHQL